jgi:signal transduction histidine kinase
LNILLVDDDEVDRLAVARALRSAGLDATVMEACDAMAAAAAVEERVFDAVLLDFRLPGGDGLDVLRSLRLAGVATPVIVLTGHGDEQTAVELMKAGAADYLSKHTLSGDRLAQSLRNATERQRLQEERDQLLVREQQAREEAERANAAKDQFLATLSHELRTPLNAILGWSRILSTTPVDRTRFTHALAVIDRNANLQLQLINDLLDVSRIISGKLELKRQQVDLAKICEAALDSLQPQIEAKRITVAKRFDPGTPLLLADAGRLQQVIWNLLTNAVKFTPDGGTVRLELRRVQSHVEVVVSDTGCGIDPAVLPRIFDRFVQAQHATSPSHGGLGLGLAIVRHLAEMHGGSVDADSAGEGKGAQFTLVLPVQAVSRAAVDANQRADFRPPERLDGIRVLFIDDNPDARDLVATMLTDAGAKVRTSDSMDAALLALKRERPDVLISDIEMPDGDGYQMIRSLRLRDEDTDGPIPAIALTGATRPEDRIRILAAGYQLHVPKPVDPGELVAAVASLVGPHRHEQSSRSQGAGRRGAGRRPAQRHDG